MAGLNENPKQQTKDEVRIMSSSEHKKFVWLYDQPFIACKKIGTTELFLTSDTILWSVRFAYLTDF